MKLKILIISLLAILRCFRYSCLGLQTTNICLYNTLGTEMCP